MKMKITLVEARQDLGVAIDGTNLAPSILTEPFRNEKIDIKTIEKDNQQKEKDKNNHAKNLDGVNNFNTRLYETISKIKDSGSFPLTIGGDHSVAIGSALASLNYEKEMGIIWIDAHGDYNTLDTTITGNLHGLPLAANDGLCPPLTTFHKGPFFKKENTVIVGGRDIDPLEQENINQNRVKLFSTNDIHQNGVKQILNEAFAIASKNNNKVHISIDLDVIDPLLAPGVSVPAQNGLSLEEFNDLINELIKRKEMIKSLDIVEYNPLKDINDKTKKIAIDTIKKVIENF